MGISFVRFDRRETRRLLVMFDRKENSCIFPDPPTLHFLGGKKGNPEKSKGVSLCGTPKILGKGRKAHKKTRKIGKQKKQGKKKQELEGQGWGLKIGIVQKVFSPKGVPRIFDAFLTQI